MASEPMFVHVTSLDDPRLAAYAQLTDLQLRNRLEPEQGIFIAEGEKVIRVALDRGYEPISLLTEEKWLPGLALALSKIENPKAELPVFIAEPALLKDLAGYEVTRGALAAFRRKPLPDLDAILGKYHVVAVLEGITNAMNVGALFRNAAALGVDAVVIDPTCCDPLYRRALRSSMGTALCLPWTRFGEDTAARRRPALLQRALHQQGFTTIALALTDDAIDLSRIPPNLRNAKVALFLGAEGTGLTPQTLSSCDYRVKIPMARNIDSLNVAAASAIAFWEFARNSMRNGNEDPTAGVW